jgi:signal transduction histidine kinase
VLHTVTWGNATEKELETYFDQLEQVLKELHASFPESNLFHVLELREDSSIPIAYRKLVLRRVTELIQSDILHKSILVSNTVWSRVLGRLVSYLVDRNHVRIESRFKDAFDYIEQCEKKEQSAAHEQPELENLSKQQLIELVKEKEATARKQLEAITMRIATLHWDNPPVLVLEDGISEPFKPLFQALEWVEEDIQSYKLKLQEQQLANSATEEEGKQKEQVLTHQLRMLLDGSEEGILLIDRAGIILDFNKQLERNILQYLGIPLERGMSLDHIAPTPELRELWRHRMELAFQGQQSVYLDEMHHEGGIIHYKLRYVPTTLNGSVADYIIVFQTDITTFIEQSKHLLERNVFVDNLLRTVPGLLFIVNNRSNKIEYQSRSASLLFNATTFAEDAPSLDFQQVLHPDDLEAIRSLTSNVNGQRETEAYTTECRVCVPGQPNKWEWIALRARPFSKDAKGEIENTIVFAYNVHQARENREKLMRNLEYERALSSLSGRLVGLNISNFRQTLSDISEELHQIGLFDVGLSLLWDNHSGHFSEVFWEKEKKEITSSMRPILAIEWLKTQFAQYRHLMYGSWKQLPKGANPTITFFEEMQVHTLLLLPASNESGCFGCFVLMKQSEDAFWTNEELNFLYIMAEMLSNSIAKLNYERALSNQRSKLNAVLENTADSVWSVDLKFRFQAFNTNFRDSFRSSFGHEIEIGTNSDSLIPHAVWEEWELLYQRAFKGEKFIHEWAFDNQVYELSFHPVVENGLTKGCTVFSKNITYRRIFESKLLKSENILSSIINNSNDYIWLTDADLRLVKFNQKTADSAYASFGVHLEPGMEALVLQLPDENKVFWKDLYSYALQNKKVNEEWFVRDQYYQVIINPICEQDEVRFLGVYMTDITQRKEVENTIREQNEELMKVNKELDGFVYKASHDLRAPLVSILGLINITRMETDEVKKATYLDLQEQSVRKLDKYIQDIIDYSRNARQEVQHELVDMEALVQGILEQNRYSIDDGRLQLHFDSGEQREFLLDRRRIEVVLNNLISNAIRYQDPSKDALELHIHIRERKGIHLTISDNGIGIGQEHQARVFDMFYRATTSRTGSGLGLYIVKESISKMGGSIVLTSAPGKGTTFEIILPTPKQVIANHL